MNTRWSAILFAAALALGAAARADVPDAKAEEEEHAIVTDRPGATDSSEVVGKYHLHFEAGLDLESFKDEDRTRTDQWRTPFELRFGITEALEAALTGDGFAYDWVKPEDETGDGHLGAGDLGLRLRYHFLDRGGDENMAIPSAAIFLDVELPTGTIFYRDHGLIPAMKVAFDWSLPADFGLSVNLGFIVPHDDNGSRFFQTQAAFNVSRPLTPLTDKVGVYFSIGSLLPDTDRTHDVAVMDTGIVCFPIPSLQLDVEYLQGLNDRGPDRGIGLGFCYRLR